MNYDFGSENFKSQLKQKSNEIGERLASPVIDAPSFLLLRNLLKTASVKFALNDFRCITIKRAEFDYLPDDMDEKVDALFKGSDFIHRICNANLHFFQRITTILPHFFQRISNFCRIFSSE